MANIPSGLSMALYYGQSIFFFDADNSNVTEFKAAATTTGDATYTWPVALPATTGFVLSCTTSGAMSWVANGTPTPAALTASTGITATGTPSTALLQAVTLSVNQAFTPTWTGAHIFDSSVKVRTNSGGQNARVGGNLYTGTTDISDNTGGSTPVQLDNYTIGANCMGVVGDTVRVEASGIHFGRALQQNLTFKWGGTTLLGNTSTYAVDTEFIFQMTASVKTTGSSGVVKYQIRYYEFQAALSASAALSATKFANGELSIDLTADKTLEFLNTTSLTGATPYATEYTMLVDFISKGS